MNAAARKVDVSESQRVDVLAALQKGPKETTQILAMGAGCDVAHLQALWAEKAIAWDWPVLKWCLPGTSKTAT